MSEEKIVGTLIVAVLTLLALIALQWIANRQKKGCVYWIDKEWCSCWRSIPTCSGCKRYVSLSKARKMEREGRFL